MTIWTKLDIHLPINLLIPRHNETFVNSGGQLSMAGLRMTLLLCFGRIIKAISRIEVTLGHIICSQLMLV